MAHLAFEKHYKRTEKRDLTQKTVMVKFDSSFLVFFYSNSIPQLWLLDPKANAWTQKSRLPVGYQENPAQSNPKDPLSLMKLNFFEGDILAHGDCRLTLIGRD